MKNLRWVTAVGLIAGACVAAANQHPNTAKGFNPSGVYQMNGIDSVSAFNGNLTLTIPIGQRYSIGGGLSYQLRLYGNGNLWEPEERLDLEDETSNDCGSGDPIVPCIQAYPDRRANAGLGFTLSLGRLFPMEEQTNESTGWIYESPDGSEHQFFEDIHPTYPDGDPATFYTRDGTYLRMKVDSSTQRRIEFPSGEVHTFEPSASVVASNLLSPWRVKSIGSTYDATAIEIAYATYGPTATEPATATATLDDGYRTQTISYQSLPFESGIEDMFVEVDPIPELDERMLVEKVTLSAFGGGSAVYEFHYQQSDLQRPDWHTVLTAYAPNNARVQLLSTLDLPDGGSFGFEYITNGTSGMSGLPWRMALPTGGKIKWDWGYYQFPDWTGDISPHRVAPGVRKRYLYDRADVLLGTWQYTPVLDGTYNQTPPPVELAVTIEDPLLNKTINYFDVSYFDAMLQHGRYGLPFTPKEVDASGTRNLSQKFFAAGSTSPLRSTFVRYEAAVGRDFPPASTRTVYHDDGNAYLDSDSSDWDGLGHYRTVTTRGTGVPTRTGTTSYNQAASGIVVIPPGSPWILDTYTARTVAENARVMKAEFDFNPANGFLRRVRTIKDTGTGTRGSADVVTMFTPDSSGNVVREEIFGGDGASLPNGSLDTLNLSASDRVSRVDHEYAFGSLKRSWFVDALGQPMSFNNQSSDIDQSTGYVRISRDSSDVPTEYRYDSSGRLIWSLPTGRAWTSYAYPDFATINEIRVDVFKPGTFTASSVTPGTRIGRSRYVLDGIGRALVEYVEMPGGAESRRETVVNALGWQMEVSELGSGVTLPRTIFTRDMFGRVLTATAPDLSLIAFSYTGTRTKTRTSSVSTVSPSASDTPIVTIEESDLYGRLVRVTEKSGPTRADAPIGAEIQTAYAYDLADRLTHVAMNQMAAVHQTRSFTYDGRGFLVSESQPESGEVEYTYNGRGDVLSKTSPAGDVVSDLRYSYDSAGRLLLLEGRSGLGQATFRPLKEYAYGVGNALPDRRNGKLTSASRYNYGRGPFDYVYKVEELYSYRDSAGRLTNKTTGIVRDPDAIAWQPNRSYPASSEVTPAVTNGYVYRSEPDGGPDPCLSASSAPAWVAAAGSVVLDGSCRWKAAQSLNARVIKTIDMAVEYNELDLPSTITYPTCTDCGGPLGDPQRTAMERTYDHGRLIALGRPNAQAFVQNVTYWPNGMRHLLTHGNGITDTQTVVDMPRPSEIKFGTYERCVKPTIGTQPFSTTGGAAVMLSVTASGTGPFEYEWYNETNGVVVGADAPTVTVNPTITTDYHVTIIGPCGIVQSQTARVSVAGCPLPTTGAINALLQPDGSFILRPNPTARAGRTFAWRQVPSSAVVGTAEDLAVPAPSSTVTYSLTIQDTCGTSATTTVTIGAAVAMSSATIGLQAWQVGPTSIDISWPVAPGATTYVLERRSGSTWQEIAQLAGTTYHDAAVVANRTYAYRVYAIGEGAGSTSVYSNADVATTRSFVGAVPSAPVTLAPVNDMLAAVNSVRAAVGWTSLTWSTILTANEPSPVAGGLVLGRHVTACRARMNEALQALGVPVGTYSPTNLVGAPITAFDINDVQQRAQ